jgi:coproporphyrinogen III oxidase-like Fe-S oxidoreductase
MHLIKSRFRGRVDSPIEKIGLGKILRSLISAPRAKGLRTAYERPPGAERRVAYMHIPFCSTRCPYCPFHVGLAGALREPFVEATVKLIESLGDKPFVAGRPFDVYYFGGGSPTSLLSKQLQRLLKVLMEKFPPSPGHEFTVESTIGDLDAEKLAMLKDHGVTRISVGVQSFDAQVRRSVGRASGQEAVFRALEMLQKSSRANPGKHNQRRGNSVQAGDGQYLSLQAQAVCQHRIL